jgi:hypothetical protein
VARTRYPPAAVARGEACKSSNRGSYWTASLPGLSLVSCHRDDSNSASDNRRCHCRANRKAEEPSSGSDWHLPACLPSLPCPPPSVSFISRASTLNPFPLSSSLSCSALRLARPSTQYPSQLNTPIYHKTSAIMQIFVKTRKSPRHIGLSPPHHQLANIIFQLLARPSPLRSSPPTPSTTSSPRFRTRKAFLLISSA